MKFKIVNAGVGLRVEDKRGRAYGLVPPSMSPREALDALAAMDAVRAKPSDPEWLKVWVAEAFQRALP